MQESQSMQGDAAAAAAPAFCLSFSSYTSDKLAETAARVAGENPSAADLAGGDLERIQEEFDEEDEDAEEFEFSLVRSGDGGAFAIPATEVTDFGHFQPIFPVFDRDLLLRGADFEASGVESIRVPLNDLFFRSHEDRDRDPPSSSESDADESVSADAAASKFCVWAPKAAAAAAAAAEVTPGRCRKSKSTGSSLRRWRFIDLLRRSNSTDEKDSFVFLTPVGGSKKKKDEKAEKSGESKVAGKGKSGKFSAAHETFYAKNRAVKDGEKRRSYLPYRQDLVGFFARVNGLGRKYPPF